MWNQQNKRQRQNADEQISAGLIQSTDETFLSANIVNLSVFDGTPQHGLPSTFNQSRTTQIIGNTSRSEIGVISCEIQTKTLPVFQPQVKLGTDINALIYEIGTSAVWSGCLINQSIVGAGMAVITNDTAAQLQTIQTCGSPTLMCDPIAASSELKVTDTYGDTFPLRLLPSNTKHTLLKTYIDFHSGLDSQFFYYTPFKPVCVPSVYQPILFMAPLRLEATPSTITGNYVVVADASGFQVGDKVRLYGTYDSAGGSVEIKNYVTIRSICLYSDLVVGGALKNPTTDAPNILTATVLVFNDLGVMAATASRLGGYVINTRINSSGGRVQYLTDEFEYRPRTSTLVSSSAITVSNNVILTVPGTLGQGLLRTGDSNFVKVALTSTDQPELNGIYLVNNITGGSSPFTVTLKPLTVTVPTVGSYTAKTAILQLAPNGYTVDCSSIDSSIGRVRFMNNLGFQPTKTIKVVESAYPPAMTQPTQTWLRAYSVELPFSAYRNLHWVTEDVDVLPSLPVIVQDFGNDSGSSYYNCYDFQQFISQCVNPAFEKLFTQDISDVDLSNVKLEQLPLNSQLLFVANAYLRAFTIDHTSLLYNATTSYQIGQSVVRNGSVWTPTVTPLQGVEPALTSVNWLRIGDAPRTVALANNLLFTYTANGWSFICSGGVSSTPEVIRPATINSIQFKSRPVVFKLDGITNLLSYEVDTLSFGNTYPYDFIQENVPFSDQFIRDIRNSNYRSWGYKNATDKASADETINIETNSSFKFLFDNFSTNAIRYIEPTTNSLLIYWLWYQYTDASFFDASRRFFQSSESLSSSLSPVQSIVILSKSVPVVQTLLSPAAYISDINTAIANTVGTVGDSDSILGEFYIEPGMLTNSRSVIRYLPDQPTMYSLQSTKIFKQIDFTVCYRHRITQKLVPLNLSNYGTVNIKFVFKPI